MAGQIKSVLDYIIEKRSNGNPTLASTTKTMLILKGVNPDKFHHLSPDDQQILGKIMPMARALGYAA